MKPRLIMLLGLPGSGKTTLSTWLAQRIDLVVVSRDRIRAAMFPHCEYTFDEKIAAFEAMKVAIALSLRQGKTVCTDGITFASLDDRMAVEAVARAEGADIEQMWCDVPVDVACRRVDEDVVTVFPDRNAQMVREVAERFARPGEEVHRLDMTLPVDEAGECVLAWLRVEDA